MLRRAFLKLTVSAAVAAMVAVEAFRSPVHAFVPLTDLPAHKHEEQVVSPVVTSLRGWNDERVLAVSQGRESAFWEGPQIAPEYVKTWHVSGTFNAAGFSDEQRNARAHAAFRRMVWE